MNIGRVEISGPLICIEGIGCLIVARLVLRMVSSWHAKQIYLNSSYQSAKVVPDFGDVWIQADSTGVSVQRIAVLIDLVIQHSDRAPEGRIPAITVNGLLVCFVRFWIFLLCHVTSAKEIPALCVVLICAIVSITHHSLKRILH